MKTLGIIPSRYASTRFPGKPLANIKGKPMIQWVYENASKAKYLDRLIVATDDKQIQKACLSFGAEVKLTSTAHNTGTERCAEVSAQYPDYGIVINIQGDEPFIATSQIDQVIALCKAPNAQIGTLIKAIDNKEDLFNPNRPKVVIDHHQKACLFSRASIPFLKGIEKDQWIEHHTFYKHIGIYGYTSTILRELIKLKETSIEKAEGLEQLRWLAHGYHIQTDRTTTEGCSIDTPEDLKALLKTLQ